MCLRSVFLIPRFIHQLFVKNHSYSCKSNTTFNKVGMASEPPKKKTKTKDTTALEAESGDNEFCQNIKSLRLNTASSVTNFKFNKKRARVLSEVEEFEDDCGGIVYWMSRDQRVQDNWAFLYAQRLAMKLECPLHVCFCLVPKFLEATIRQFGFMLKGLEEVEKECTELGIPFHLLIGYAKNVLPEFLEENDISGVVTDFSPLRVPMKWAEELKAALPKNVPLCQVDAHNVVPVWQASPKQEYSARTIRNKIHNQLKEYFTEFPPVIKHPYPAKTPAKPVDWVAAEASLEVDRTVEEVDWAKPGTTGGLLMLESFIKKRLSIFNKDRNNPNKQALSNMSPWYHFGQVSVQRAMLMVNPLRNRFKESVDGYIEEGIIRRELADNFCFYNSNYDNIQGAHEWAQKTLKDHWKDKREKVYTQQQLEEAKTHDDLWNGAQTQMVCEGKMHGFLRMYWAKKILEWTENPDEALRISLYLNDKYQLDGRDPSGYVGCMWSICGTHDQGWAERAVFGKIRYMNYQGCKRKFDVSAFEMKYRAKARAMKR